MHQLSLTLEPGLASKFKDLRECFASCVYQRGLGRVAAAIDVAPSNLSTMLSGERNLDVGLVERYMDHFADPLPALFWAARFLQSDQTRQQEALAQIPGLVAQLQRLVTAAKDAA